MNFYALFAHEPRHDDVGSTEPKADASDLYQLCRPREKAAQWLAAASPDTSTRLALPDCSARESAQQMPPKLRLAAPKRGCCPVAVRRMLI